MECPVCKSVSLARTTRQGIDIDYCPTCRGVWLDRGELDKIIERSSTGQMTQHVVDSTPESAYPHQPNWADHAHTTHHGGSHRRKKREGFLGELFDFD